jgi:hypothetical protein
MTESMNQAASGNLPWFVTAPGETDTLMAVMGVILILFLFDDWHPVFSFARFARSFCT